MRQKESITRNNLLAHLQAIHPADVLGGIFTIRDFALNEFHGGIDPRGKNEQPIFKEAAEQWACYSQTPAESFPELLNDYARLLANFAAWLTENGLTAAHAQITRIQSGLALQGATLQRAPARGARWREALACALAIAGAVLLETSCTGELWRHFTALLALALVATSVWWLARRRAPVAQPLPAAK